MKSFASWERFSWSIGFEVTEPSEATWYDLEEFVVDGAIFSTSDARLFSAYVFFLEESIDLLSAGKIKRILKIKDANQKTMKILGFSFERALSKAKNKAQWKRLLVDLKERIKNTKTESVFNFRPFREDESMLTWGLSSSGIGDNGNGKYFSEIRMHSSQVIKLRKMGLRPVFVDYLIARKYFPDLSVNRVGKLIFWDYSQVHFAAKSLSDLKNRGFGSISVKF